MSPGPQNLKILWPWGPQNWGAPFSHDTGRTNLRCTCAKINCLNSPTRNYPSKICSGSLISLHLSFQTWLAYLGFVQNTLHSPRMWLYPAGRYPKILVCIFCTNRLHQPFARTNSYMYSFVPSTISKRNMLPCHGEFGTPDLWHPRAKCPREIVTPKQNTLSEFGTPLCTPWGIWHPVTVHLNVCQLIKARHS